MSRETVIRRCLRQHDAGASIEHILGEAYNAGHVEGSGVKRFTEIEVDMLASLRLLSDAEVAILCERFTLLSETLPLLRTEEPNGLEWQSGASTVGHQTVADIDAYLLRTIKDPVR